MALCFVTYLPELIMKFMLSIEECKRYLKKLHLSDKEVEKLRDCLYIISGKLIDKYIADKEREKLDDTNDNVDTSLPIYKA